MGQTVEQASCESDTGGTNVSSSADAIKDGASQHLSLAHRGIMKGRPVSRDNTELGTTFVMQQHDRSLVKTRLPFPSEIRKQIYECLLLSKYVLDDPDNGSPHTYTFHTGILRVSRATYQESRPVLYKSNIFVLVHYTGHFFEQNTRGFGVPLVSTHHLEAFREHRLIARFTTPKPHRHAASEGVCEECMRDPTLTKCLMLAQDLHFLCRMFKAFSFGYLGKYTFIKSARDQRPIKTVTSRPNTPACMIDLEICPGSFGPPTVDEQNAVLEPFRAIHGAAYQVTVTGQVDAQLAGDVKREMSQNVIWVYAMGWDFVEMARQLKNEANRAIMAGNFKPAEWKYNVVFSIWGKNVVPCDDNGTYKDQICCDWRQSLSALSFDTNYMLGMLAMRAGDWDEAELFAKDLFGNALAICHGTDRKTYQAYHFSAIVMSAREDYQVAYTMMDQAIAGLSSDAGVQADMEILQAYVAYNCPCENVSTIQNAVLKSVLLTAYSTALTGQAPLHHHSRSRIQASRPYLS